MSVDTQHPEYNNMIDQWSRVGAAASGSVAVKALGVTLLPAPGEKDGKYDKDRYEAYKKRAVYTNITGRTKSGMIGAAFRKPPELDLSGDLEFLAEDADGAGQSIDQMAKGSLSRLLTTGRDGLLVDHPETEEGLTAEDQAKLDHKPYIKSYSAQSIINWKVESVGGRAVLVLVVLKESYAEDQEDEFSHEEKEQYRVLRLRDDGYTQQVYRGGEAYTDEVYPSTSDKGRWPEIPFFFIGAVNNDPSVDEIPLADIAEENIAHYRNSADLEENCFIHGQLTLGVQTNLSSAQFEEANPTGIEVGARKGHFLGETGAFHSVQAEPNQLSDNLMERKEARMLMLGARLVEQRNPQETATAAKIDAAGSNSVLGDLVANVEEAYQTCINWCAEFAGDSHKNTILMNREFFPGSVDAHNWSAAIQLFDRGAIAKVDLQRLAKSADILEEDRTEEEIDNESEDSDPTE